jgi:hypothetical protein
MGRKWRVMDKKQKQELEEGKFSFYTHRADRHSQRKTVGPDQETIRPDPRILHSERLNQTTLCPLETPN